MEGLALDARRIAAERARGIWPERVATDYLDRWVEEKPDATAIVGWRLEEEAATTLTWRGLATRVAGTAAALEAAGVRQGDVVSFQLPNWWEFVALFFATVRLGAVANPLMPIFRQRELAFMLGGEAEARVFVVPERFRGFDHGALARQLAARDSGHEAPGVGDLQQPLAARIRRGWRGCARTTSSSFSTPPARPASRRAHCIPPTRFSARCAHGRRTCASAPTT